MTSFPAFMLLATCFTVIYWSFLKEWRIYELPFLVSLAFAGFIVPQSFGIYNNPGPVSLMGLDMTLFMGILCVLCCWIGYLNSSCNYTFLAKINLEFDSEKMFYFGVIYSIIGTFFFVLIGNLPTEATADSQWSGIAVAYLFFARLIYPGFALLVIPTLMKPTKLKWTFCLLATFWPLMRFLLFGRRTETIIFLFILVIALFFVKRYTVPKQWLILSIILGIFFTYGIGDYRSLIGSHKSFGGNNVSIDTLTNVFNAIRAVDWSGNFQEVLNGKTSYELRFAASVVEVANKTGEFGWGSAYWNKLIFNYVPAQLVGASLKSSFYLPRPDFISLIYQEFGTNTFKTGLTITSVGELFLEFWFFGALIYYAMSFLFKNIWILATRYANPMYQVIYVLIAPFALISVTASTANFLSQFVYYVAFLTPVCWYSQVKFKSRNSQLSSYSK